MSFRSPLTVAHCLGFFGRNGFCLGAAIAVRLRTALRSRNFLRRFFHLRNHQLSILSGVIARQEVTGILAGRGRNLCRAPLRNNTSAVFAPLGAQVDYPVGISNHVHAVFNDDHRVAQIGQPVKHLEQLAHVIKM